MPEVHGLGFAGKPLSLPRSPDTIVQPVAGEIFQTSFPFAQSPLSKPASTIFPTLPLLVNVAVEF